MKKDIEKIFKESVSVKEQAFLENAESIVSCVKEITKAIKKGKKVLFFGNGGSAADSQHMAAEFIGRFKKERGSLAAIALTTDTSLITSLSNDYSFDIIFKRQIEGLGKKGDVAFGISTSGNSRNVLEGIKKAKDIGMKTIALTGSKGGKLSKIADINIIVPSSDTARIQESHLCIEHIICELVERQF